MKVGTFVKYTSMTYINADITYVYCPECGGEGKQMHGELRPTGHAEVWRPCEFCDGLGDFEEADYLVMKLAGTV